MFKKYASHWRIGERIITYSHLELHSRPPIQIVDPVVLDVILLFEDVKGL